MRKTVDLEKIFVRYDRQIDGWIDRIKDLNPEYTEKLHLTKKETIHFFKRTKDLNRHFTKEDIWVGVKHMKDAQHHQILKLQ